MADLTIFVGHGKKGTLSFDEPGAPADGAVTSSDPAVSISLDPTDHATWTATGNTITAADVTITYTGTSDPPDVGPVQVTPMTVAVVAAPAAETGSFNPSSATDV